MLFMSSGIYAPAAVAINLNIRKICELAGFKLKRINKSSLAYFVMAFYIQPHYLRFSALGVFNKLTKLLCCRLPAQISGRNQPVLGSGLCILDFSTLKAILIQIIVI